MHIDVEPGVRINVEDRGGGSPVVFLHGWSLSHKIFDRQIELLVDAGYRAIAIDLRGHGSSQAPPAADFSIARLADDVLAVLRALDVGHATLVGYSLGGLVALRVATSAPERVVRMVLVASNGVAHARHPGFPFGIEPEAAVAAMEAGELADRVRSRRALLRNGFGSPPDEGALDRVLQISLQAQPHAVIGCLRSLMLTDQTHLLTAVACPVVQILGADDPTVSRRGGDWLVSELVDAEQVVLSCGHYPMLEAAEAFDEALAGAVGGLPAARPHEIQATSHGRDRA